MPNLFSGPKVVVLNRAMSQLLIPAARRLESTRASVPYPQSGGGEKQSVLNHSSTFAAWLPVPPAPLAHPWTASGRMLAMPRPSHSRGVRAGPSNLEREALLESGNSVHAPSGDDLVQDAGSITHIPLAVAEGQIVNVAKHQALRDVLRGQRALACEIIVVLHLPHTARRAFQPTGKSVGVGHQLRVGVSRKERSAIFEPLCGCKLERIVRAFAAAISGQLEIGVLRVRTVKLALRKRCCR